MRVFLILALLFAAACGSDAPTEPAPDPVEQRYYVAVEPAGPGPLEIGRATLVFYYPEHEERDDSHSIYQERGELGLGFGSRLSGAIGVRASFQNVSRESTVTVRTGTAEDFHPFTWTGGRVMATHTVAAGGTLEFTHGSVR